MHSVVADDQEALKALVVKEVSQEVSTSSEIRKIGRSRVAIVTMVHQEAQVNGRRRRREGGSRAGSFEISIRLEVLGTTCIHSRRMAASGLPLNMKMI